MEYLTSPPAQEEIVANAELAATRTCRRPSTSPTGPTSSATRSTSSGPGQLPSAIALMQKVGWK